MSIIVLSLTRIHFFNNSGFIRTYYPSLGTKAINIYPIIVHKKYGL